MELKLENGIYKGEVKDGKANGIGIIVFDNGDKYKGHFVDNMAVGVGKCVYSNGCTYEGDVKDFLPDGKGIFIYNDNRFYEGEFSEGRFSGKGKYFNGQVNYEGIFCDNEIVINYDNITSDLENIGLNLSYKKISIHIDSCKKEFLVYINNERYRKKYDDFQETLKEIVHIIDANEKTTNDSHMISKYRKHTILEHLVSMSYANLVLSILLALVLLIDNIFPNLIISIYIVAVALFMTIICRALEDMDSGIAHNKKDISVLVQNTEANSHRIENLEMKIDKKRND